MFSAIKQKLNSRSGVTVVLALFLLLICAFAGSAAITAAGENVGRYQKNRDYQQQYLSITSAADLLREKLDGTVTGKLESGSFKTEPLTDIFDVMNKGSDIGSENAIDNMLKIAACNEGINEGIIEEKPADPTDLSFEMSVEDDDRFGTVVVTISYPKNVAKSHTNTMQVKLSLGEYNISFDVSVSVIYSTSENPEKISLEFDTQNARIISG